MGGGPFGVVKSLAPMAVSLALGQKLGAPTFGCNALTQIGAFFMEQIAIGLVLDRDVSIQEPLEDTWAWHGQ